MPGLAPILHLIAGVSEACSGSQGQAGEPCCCYDNTGGSEVLSWFSVVV